MGERDKCILCGIGTIIWVYEVGRSIAWLKCSHCGASGKFKKEDKECVCDPYIGFTCPSCYSKYGREDEN